MSKTPRKSVKAGNSPSDITEKHRLTKLATTKAHREIALNKARFRSSTIENAQQSASLQIQRSFEPTGGHINAVGRAVPDLLDPTTSQRNLVNVNTLSKAKEYKSGALRVHYKGSRLANGSTTGNLLSGSHIDRSSWSAAQTLVSQNLGETLKKDNTFVPANHNGGTHGAEIAHVRAQHAGGMTDELGAQPASWHFNVEDMAREEGQNTLAKKFGDNVRMKSTVYVHQQGEFAGTVKARRHKIYFKDAKGNWAKKFDHLQDGARGNINKTEAASLRSQVESLTEKSPNTSLHGKNSHGINPKSDLLNQKNFMPKVNDSVVSPYFTDITQVRKSTQVVKPISSSSTTKKKPVTVTNKERLAADPARTLMQGILTKAALAISKK